jgi:hypothetical protein
MPERFLRVEDSITYVFSIRLHSPIPPAGTIDSKAVSIVSSI